MKNLPKVSLMLFVVFSFLLMGLSDADALIPNKSEWQTKKKAFNLPSGLSKKVKLGKAFDKYYKKQDFKDPQKTIDACEELASNLAAYMKDLKELKKTKRKKKPIQKAEAFSYLKGVMGEISQINRNMEDILKPGLAVKREIRNALRVANKLKADSPQKDFHNYNSQQYRGIGTKFGSLKKKCEKCKDPIEKFNKRALKVDTMVNAKPFNGKKTLQKIKASLERLNTGLDDAGAW